MELQTLTFLIVGLTFALYIGIAIWARASTTSEFYIAGGGIHPVANGMPLQQIGCRPHRLFRWRA
jgi:cation/acetate symporter